MILKEMGKEWQGSCHGITLSLALVNNKYVSVEDISNTYPESYFLLDPNPNNTDSDQKFNDMINYYQLSQYIENGGKSAVIAQTNSDNGLSFASTISNAISSITLHETLATMVDKASKNEPYLLSFGYKNKKGNNSGHTVYVLGSTKPKSVDGYDLIIYDCNKHKIDYHYVTISSDYNSFTFNGYKIYNNEDLSQNNYNYLQVTDLAKMKNTSVLSSNIPNIDKDKKQIIVNKIKLNSAPNNKVESTYISFDTNTSFTLKTSTGKTLIYNGDNFSGNLTVNDLTISGTETPCYTLTIDTEDELTFSNNGKAFDVTAFYKGKFYSVNSERASSAVINKDGLSLDGKDYDFTAQTGVMVSGEPTLVAVSGKTNDKLFLSNKDNKPSVESDHELKNVTISSFSPSNNVENKYDVVKTTFDINSKDATIPENKDDSDLRIGDVNNDGKINVTDITKVAAHIKGKRLLDDVARKRADVNHDEKINVTDITKIAAHIKGKRLLS
jgi:hypothetical protein